MNIYETDALVAQYCEFHYGETYFDVLNYPKACIDAVVEIRGQCVGERALDLGCAVGRSTFELAKHFDEAIGVDYSNRFVQVGEDMRERGSIQYSITDEGQLSTSRDVSLDSLGLESARDKASFRVGDATDLDGDLTGFDCIVGFNLIDRLEHPNRFLRDIRKRLNPGGMLVLTSPYTWLEEYTPAANWVGGFLRDGNRVETFDGLKQRLDDDFELVGWPQDIPFVIRETRRKFQHTLAQFTAWKLK